MQKNQKIPYLSLLFCFFLFLGGFFLGHRDAGTPVLHAERELPARSVGETEPSTVFLESSPTDPILPQSNGLVNLNTATPEELKTLPGIGDVLAQRILDYRTQNGPFHTPEELMQVKGIGEKIYDGLRNLIDLGGTQ